MFDRFRKSDRGREEERTVVREERATAVADRDDAPATTVHERERTVRDPDDAPATTMHERETTVRDPDRQDATRVRDPDEDRLAALRDRDPDRDHATRVRERDDRLAPSDRFDRDEVRTPRTLAPVVGDETLVAMHDRQRIRFGGFSWGSAFFGLLSAIGLAAILLGIVAAAGVAIGVSEINDVTNGDADTIGLGGAILVLAILALSWFCGGYVAGRMARFDGVRQGLAVWVWTVLVGAALAIVALIGGSDYDVFARLNLPNVAVGDQTLTTGGAITLAAACVVTLIFAVLGGKVGDRFHRRVDRFAAREYLEEP
ncbi:MAG TPA: YrzE family protein [Solirubrobacteraceae bacterium]|nr:YrzE family protein [Solirubrobacteraceae bacterium]